MLAGGASGFMGHRWARGWAWRRSVSEGVYLHSDQPEPGLTINVVAQLDVEGPLDPYGAHSREAGSRGPVHLYPHYLVRRWRRCMYTRSFVGDKKELSHVRRPVLERDGEADHFD